MEKKRERPEGEAESGQVGRQAGAAGLAARRCRVVGGGSKCG